MSPKAPSILKLSTRVVALLGGVALALSGEIKLAPLLFFGVLFSGGLLLENYASAAMMIGRLQPAGVLLVFGAALFDYFRISQSFLLAVAHFILAIQAFRLLALQSCRENLGSLLLSSLAMLSAATLSVDWTFLFILLIFIPSLLWTLIVHTVALENMSLSWKAILPTLRRATAWAFAVSFGCCAVVFVIFPRFNLRGFRGQFLEPVHRSGFTNQVDLDQGGAILLDTTVAMRVAIDPRQKALWSGYLQGATLDNYDGKIWKRSRNAHENIFYGARSFAIIPGCEGMRGPFLKQIIFLESMESSALFAAPTPVRLKIGRPYIFVGPDGSMRRITGDTWRTHYEVWSSLSRSKISRGKIPSSPGSNQENQNEALKLPDGPSTLKIRSLALGVTRLASSPQEKAQRLIDYLEKNYAYTLNVPRTESKDSLSQFLFVTKAGHCEYFASSLAVMLRTLGIPSRLVTGFRSMEWNERGGYYIVRMSHAHAWVEADFPQEGWTSLDPTPRVWEKEDRGHGWLKGIKDLADALNMHWNQYILSYDMDRQMEVFNAVGRRSSAWSNRFYFLRGQFSVNFSWPHFKGGEIRWREGKFKPVDMAGVVLILMFAGLLYGIRMIRRKKTNQAGALYRQLDRYLKKAGAPADRGATIRERFLLLQPHLLDRWSDAQLLMQTYYEARFNPQFHPTTLLRKEFLKTLKTLKTRG